MELSTLRAELHGAYPDDWQAVLNVLTLVGVADTTHLTTLSGVYREKVNRILARCEDLAPTQIVNRVEVPLTRGTRKGRAPVVYRLGELGARLLQARPSQLTDPTAIAHALALLDVRQCAFAAGLRVVTDSGLPFGDDQVIRPDNAITLPNGVTALFETEQKASPDTLRRLLTKLAHLRGFFESAESNGYSGFVRVLLSVPAGRPLEQTRSTWEKALAVATRDSGALPFAMRFSALSEFVAQPDWSDPPDPSRWEDLFDPNQLADFGDAPTVAEPAHLPMPLRRLSTRESVWVLDAYWQAFQEQTQTPLTTPDPAFFELLTLIYTASHDEALTARQQAAMPEASLYLLRRYLLLHPDLHQALQRAIKRGGAAMRWNVAICLHKMQAILDVFLRYHGWVSGRQLLTRPRPGELEDETPLFTVGVRLDPHLFISIEDPTPPDKTRMARTEHAVSWVLSALFRYAEALDLPRLAFW